MSVCVGLKLAKLLIYPRNVLMDPKVVRAL